MNILMRILAGILSIHMYAMSGYVKDIDYDAPFIECVDYGTGNKWRSKDVGQFDFDDDVLLIMWDNMTEDRLDDVVVKVCPDMDTIYMEAFYMKGAN